MIIDRLLNVSTAQALTAAAVSEDSVDLTNARDIGAGEPLIGTFLVVTALLASGGAATLTVELISADDAALTSNVVSHASTEAIPKASLVAGYKRTLAVPPRTNIGADRYWGFRYTPATNDFTSGTLDAWFGPRDFNEQVNQYPDALLVSGF